MSVSVIERRRIITHAEDASIVLWLLKRKRWKYELDNGVEVVDSEDSESRRTCLYASLFISICVARLGGLPVSHSLAGWQPQAAGVQVSDSELESLPLAVICDCPKYLLRRNVRSPASLKFHGLLGVAYTEIRHSATALNNNVGVTLII